MFFFEGAIFNLIPGTILVQALGSQTRWPSAVPAMSSRPFRRTMALALMCAFCSIQFGSPNFPSYASSALPILPIPFEFERERRRNLKRAIQYLALNGLLDLTIKSLEFQETLNMLNRLRRLRRWRLHQRWVEGIYLLDRLSERSKQENRVKQVLHEIPDMEYRQQRWPGITYMIIVVVLVLGFVYFLNILDAPQAAINVWPFR